MSKKIVLGGCKNSAREIAQLCVTSEMIAPWELHSNPLSV